MNTRAIIHIDKTREEKRYPSSNLDISKDDRNLREEGGEKIQKNNTESGCTIFCVLVTAFARR